MDAKDSEIASLTAANEQLHEIAQNDAAIAEKQREQIARLTALAYAPDGREMRTVLFEEAAKRGQAEAERDALRTIADAAEPFAAHGWCDAELEDDNCQLTRHSGQITVGHWRALQMAFAKHLSAVPNEQRTSVETE